LSMNCFDIVAFLLGRCISSLCEMMMLNFVIWCMWIVDFLWIWMLDLISVNLVISWLVPGCNPWWLPNPG
jgi:hypothetical protein